jgi:DNA-binding transcriptional regulator YiaG
MKTLGDHIRRKRLDLGLRQRDVARQIGVNKDTIYNWEMNRTEPEVRVIPDIILFLGYAPYNPTSTLRQRLKAIRWTLGLSQEQFANLVNLDESTVSNWEREGHRPSKKKLEALKGFIRGLR